MKQFEEIHTYPPELKGRFNSFVVTEFDDSMTVEMQLRVLIKWIKKNIDLTNDIVDYLNDFIKNFDRNLYKTVEEILNKWLEEGILKVLINEVLLPNLERDWINARTFGIVPDEEKDQSENLQKAIDYCIEKGKGLYLPVGEIQIDNTIYIRDAITIQGKSSSTYAGNRTSRLIHKGSKDFTLLHIERPGGKTCPSVKLNSFGVFRLRNKNDDGYDPEDSSTIYNYGTKCTGIYAHVDESTFDDVIVLGMREGIIFEKSQITQVAECDLIYNEFGIKFKNANPRMSFNQNNIYRNKISLEYNASGSQHHYTNNHFEQAENHIVVNLENSSSRLYALRNITFENDNFVQYEKESKSLLEINSYGEAYTYIYPVNFVRCSVLQQYGDIVTCGFRNTSIEVRLNFDNNTILTNGTLVRGGNSYNPYVLWSGIVFNYNGGKRDEWEFFGDANIYGMNRDTNQLYRPLQLREYNYNTIQSQKKGSFFFSLDSEAPAFYNDSTIRNDIIKSFTYGNVDDKTKPTNKVVNGTIALNKNLKQGGILGWIYSEQEQDYIPLGQIGVTLGNGKPNYPPSYLGQEFFDQVNKVFYKAIGNTSADDWKKMILE